MNTFGEFVRARREHLHATNPDFSLRRTAERLGIGAAYLSQVETGKQMPTNDRIIAIAAELGLDPDVALAMAGRVADDIVAVIAARPALFTDLIRQLRDLPDHAVARVVREVADGDW